MTPNRLRDRIAAALAAEGLTPGEHIYADAVLPVVREAIAAELDATADKITGDWMRREALRDRAAWWRADQ